MNIKSLDRYTKMGLSHQDNEDYALIDDISLIICDGCSSSKYTTVGSRILAHTTRLQMYQCNGINSPEHDGFIEQVMWKAKHAAELAGLHYTALHCTLMIAERSEDEININIWGDGCVYYKYFNIDKIFITSINYTPEVPYYPIYMTESTDQQEYKSAHSRGTINIDSLSNDHNLYITPSITGSHKLNVPTKNLEFILLSTDGVESITNLQQGEVNHEITNFKLTSGAFIQRRMNRFMKSNPKHMDDITIAGYSFNKENT